jgi:hypothetical protein
MNYDSKEVTSLQYADVHPEQSIQYFDAGNNPADKTNQAVLDEWNHMSLEQQAAFDRKLVRKLDFRLVPWLSLLYLLSFLDRTNIGNAKLQGVRSLQLRLIASW